MVIGESGLGKSTLSNFISGQVEHEPCGFETGAKADLSSVTKHVTARRVRWRGIGKYFTIVDTPGFDDPQGEDADRSYLKELHDLLENQLQDIHVLVPVIKNTHAVPQNTHMYVWRCNKN